MKIIPFNHDWFYQHLGDETTRKAVTLPHDAMFFESRDQNHPSGIHGCYFAGYDYAYSKDFFVHKDDEDNLIVFEFEGVYHHAEVYVNGEKLAYRPYGYTNFYVDATKAIRFGETNHIYVIARNTHQPNSRWYSGAGIYRPVHMLVLPKDHIMLNGIKVLTLDYTLPTIEVAIKTSGSGPVCIEIFEGDKRITSRDLITEGDLKKVIKLPKAKLWSTEAPNLYQCKVTYKNDTQTVTFGIRQITYSALTGFRINGQRIILKGGCIHHDHGLLGAMNHPYADARKIRILKQAGYNAIRSAHNPLSKASLDACDHLGLLVMDEYADMWYIHKTRYDYADDLMDWYQQDLTDMVDKDFNHPSVILYSIGNEVAETSETKGIALTKTLKETISSLDPSRPVTCGINIFFNYLYSMGFGVYSDKKADKGQEVGSEFFNKLAGMFGDKTMKIGASLRGSDRKSKAAFAQLDIAGYNYGILRYKKDLKKYPNRMILGSETFCRDAYRFYELAKKHPAIIGDFVWAAQDYLGEVAIGSWEYKAYAKDFKPTVGWMSAGSGRIDLTGKPLAEMGYMRVAYELDRIRMGVVPVCFAQEAHSPSAWKMSNAVESWSWPGCEGRKTKVEVYARTHSVKLFLNDQLIGEKKNGKEGLFKFNVTYAPGQLTAVSYRKDGSVIAKTSLSTGQAKTILRAYPEETNITESDLAYIRFKYVDEYDVLNPVARGDISLSVEGGTLLAFGHACPFNDRGYHQMTSDTYYGEALAIIKPHGHEPIKVKADSVYGNCLTIIDVK